MLVFVLLFNIILIPVSYGGNLTTIILHDLKVNAENIKSNQVNVTLNSEGGALPLVTEKTVHMLPNENHTLLSLHKELGISKENSVVPRKGVHFDSIKDNISKKIQTDSDTSKTISDDTGKLKGMDIKEKSVVPRKGVVEYKVEEQNTDKNFTSLNLQTNFNKTNNFRNNTLNQSKTFADLKLNKTVVNKPRVLSYDTLREQSSHRNGELPVVQSSFKTITSDQMQSPNNPKGPIIKTVPMSASRHPGMIMPVVITILVVPMFAVLGYMALKRGKEAWKNRHYKRMDFLLDGMYND